MWLIFGYVELCVVRDCGHIWLHKAVRRERLWTSVGYIKLCVDGNWTETESLFNGDICRQRPELYLAVTWSCV